MHSPLPSGSDEATYSGRGLPSIVLYVPGYSKEGYHWAFREIESQNGWLVGLSIGWLRVLNFPSSEVPTVCQCLCVLSLRHVIRGNDDSFLFSDFQVVHLLSCLVLPCRDAQRGQCLCDG